ncbi:MAG: alpha/beta fold hydrolase [Candidatus Thermoplasmatota archaeon]
MTGAPLLFLHGVGSLAAVWTAQEAAFSGAVALEYPGYTSDAGAPETTAEGMARRLLQDLDRRGLKEVHIVGLSLGVVVALYLHAAAPHRVRSLVLADGFICHPDGAAILENGMRALNEQGMAGLAASRAPRVLAPNAPPEQVESVAAEMARIPETAYRAASRIVWLADVAALLPAVKVPVTVLVGTADVVTPPALSRALATAIPHARLEVIPGAGHLSNLDQPEAFNAAVRRHLEEIP